MPLKTLLKTYQDRVNDALEQCLPAAHIQPQRLHEAMRYSVFNGGKRVRPILVYFAAQAVHLPPAAVDAAACAVELIHAYSLVHDDLPAMDDDDLRRGKPTCHKAFDEATAILVGDALQTLAFYVLSHDANALLARETHELDEAINLTAQQRLAMLEVLAIASGSRGMVGGQMIDMLAMGKELTLAELENMHIHKTGALIRASVQLGALAAPNLDIRQLEKLDHYAKCIGLAFQIQDDILDVESSTELLGKTQGADEALDKPTYPALLGLSGAKQMAQDLIADALASLQPFDAEADPLRWMAEYIVTRKH